MRLGLGEHHRPERQRLPQHPSSSFSFSVSPTTLPFKLILYFDKFFQHCSFFVVVYFSGFAISEFSREIADTFHDHDLPKNCLAVTSLQPTRVSSHGFFSFLIERLHSVMLLFIWYTVDFGCTLQGRPLSLNSGIFTGFPEIYSQRQLFQWDPCFLHFLSEVFLFCFYCFEHHSSYLRI